MPTIPSRDTQTRIVLAAEPERVWAALLEFADNPRWTKTLRLRPWRSRPLTAGARAWLTVSATAMPVPLFVPVRVEILEPERELCWVGGPWAVVRGRHYFRLRALDDGQTELTHGERFAGLMVPLLWPVLEPELQRVYARVNADLAAHLDG